MGLGMVGVGCTRLGGEHHGWNLNGPEFLVGFILFWGAVHVAGLAWRRRLSLPEPRSGETAAEPDPYAVTYLSGGGPLTIEAAVLNLVRVGAVEVRERDGTLCRRAPPANVHPFERGVYDAIQADAGSGLKEVALAVAPGLTAIEDRLRQDGLIPTIQQGHRAMWYPMLAVLVVPVLGLLRTVQGLQRAEESGFIGLLAAFSFAVTVAVFGRPPRRSIKGEAVLPELRHRHAQLDLPADGDLSAMSGTALPLMLGLLGTHCLAGTPLQAAHERLARENAGGCGAAGCGGGGGCGGCGGCGG